MSRKWLSCLSLLIACTSSHGVANDGGGAATDAHLDSGRDVSMDAGLPDFQMDVPVDSGGPLECVGEFRPGAVVGSVPTGRFVFNYVVAGIDGEGVCPTFHLSAGNQPDFSGDWMDVTVWYPRDDIRPGVREADMSISIGGDVWNERVMVEVTHADGLFTGGIPSDDWRGAINISIHDETTDIDADLLDLHYCGFGVCLL